MSDPSLLVLSSLAGGEKHGYAMMEDIERFARTGARSAPIPSARFALFPSPLS